MIKKILFTLFCLAVCGNLGCSTSVAPNTETNKTISVNANQANLPEGLSTSQIPLSANTTPGIPDPKSDNTNAGSKSATSTPGIPDTTKAGKTPMPKNTPPIPGIPDEETLKRQMNTPVGKEVMERKPPKFESDSLNRPAAKPRATRKP